MNAAALNATAVPPNGSPMARFLGLDMTISNVIVSQRPFKDLELIQNNIEPCVLNGKIVTFDPCVRWSCLSARFKGDVYFKRFYP